MVLPHDLVLLTTTRQANSASASKKVHCRGSEGRGTMSEIVESERNISWNLQPSL